MSRQPETRGATPVGFVTELSGIEAASIMYLRMWCDGPDRQADVWNDFAVGLGRDQGSKALKTFEELCSMCVNHGRRPLMRHAVNCKCIGSDESCFANFVATATEGERDDAMLIATLLVRADMAPIVTSLAMEFGLALKLLHLRARNQAPKHQTLTQFTHSTLH